MAINWVRVAWTLAFAILGLLAFFVYVDYSNDFRQRYARLEGSGMVAGGKPAKGKPLGRPSPPQRLPRRSRKYRMRR